MRLSARTLEIQNAVQGESEIDASAPLDALDVASLPKPLTKAKKRASTIGDKSTTGQKEPLVKPKRGKSGGAAPKSKPQKASAAKKSTGKGSSQFFEHKTSVAYKLWIFLSNI